MAQNAMTRPRQIAYPIHKPISQMYYKDVKPQKLPTIQENLQNEKKSHLKNKILYMRLRNQKLEKEVNTLKGTILELQKDEAEKAEMMNDYYQNYLTYYDLYNKLQSEKDQKDAIERSLSDDQHSILKSMDKESAVDTKLQELKRKNEGLQNLCASLEKTLQETQKENQELKLEIRIFLENKMKDDNFKSRCSTLESLVGEAQKEKQNLNRIIENSGKEYDELKNKYNAMHSNVLQLEKQKIEHAEIITSLEEEKRDHDSLKIHCSSLQDSLEKSKCENSELQSQIDSMEKDFDHLKEVHKTELDRNDTIKMKMNKEEKELKKLISRLKAKHAKIKKSNDESRLTLEHDVELLKQETTRIREKYNQEILIVQEETTTLKNKLKSSETAFVDLNEEYNQVVEKTKMLEENVRSNNFEIQRLEKERDRNKTFASNMTEVIEDVLGEKREDVINFVTTNLQCSICTDLFVYCVGTNCGHLYCEECIFTWTNKKKSCPMCRTIVNEQVKLTDVDNFISKFIEKYYPKDKQSERQTLLLERKDSFEKIKEAAAKEKEIERNENSAHQIFDVEDENENATQETNTPIEQNVTVSSPFSPSIEPVLGRLEGPTMFLNDTFNRISNALNRVDNEIRETFDTPFENTNTHDYENTTQSSQEINLRISSVESLSNQVGNVSSTTWHSESEEDEDSVMVDRQEVTA